MGFVLVGHSRGASEQLTTEINLKTTSSLARFLYVYNVGP